MLFFAVTGALMAGVLGSASLGVNTQRYSDAVNTFAATVQQEFTNATNVANTKSIDTMCGTGTGVELPRGVSSCVIIGRLMTVDENGAIVRSNLVGEEPATVDTEGPELALIQSYNPKIDVASQEKDTMSWDTNLEKGNPPVPSDASILILRSPRSGNVYSYVSRPTAGIITTDKQLRDEVTRLANESTPANSRDQYLCVDRSGWVASPARAIKLAPFSSGPSGVSIVNTGAGTCA